MAFPISEIQYNKLFPNRNDIFTYQALVEAASKYPEFLNEGTDDTRLNELIAFLANVSHETTGGWPTAPGGPYAWGLHFAQEVGCETGNCTQYTDQNSRFKPEPGQTYQGRGAIQLSWNYNYGQASEAIFGDASVLLKEPSLVVQEPILAWQTAIWFWMTPQPPKPSCHEVMVGNPSAYDGDLFGETINIINGGVECGKGMNRQLENRIGFYKHFATQLNANVPPTLGSYCAFKK
ncbi:chitinase [Pseudoalteromonas umbrosa]|uniref:chitinase n=1 Tax=Pseudoalteromonas umbrosa TaxID=3048489 RepID=UPI0024C283ED|nr:chitinase [Pseudoalteromonas sp. B95]MDK1285739.1 chitinase [Pseudoalteromonas sp. B95]